MSKKQHADAKLEGWDGPFFPDSLKELKLAEDANDIHNGYILERTGELVHGFKEKFSPTTSDGYSWFWGLDFKKFFGRVAILFPWAQDWNAEDGDTSDRSIAVYTKGLVNVERTISQLIKAMIEIRKIVKK